ncbi:TRAP transporter substrate-binding protein [Kribbella sp. NPDC050241]|uniref:TRAP transporter substrate-binding protein n=1 Tax=Kribbella sp. NPDC050241 TaxID=3364115 RepID=UPI00378B03D7
MHTTKLRGWATVAVVAGLILAGTACRGPARDRAGGNADGKTRVLTFAQPNDEAPVQLKAWAGNVDRRSGGSLRIEFKNSWRDSEADYESGTVRDVQERKVDMAWVGARVLDKAGVTSFQALLAPMLVDSYDLEEKVFEAGIPAQMLQGLDAIDVVGIGVLPGPLRRVLGVRKPLVTPEAFAGTTVAIQDSALAATTLHAWGAESRAVPSGAELDGVDGYEQQLDSILGNHYAATARYVTANVNLWPRPLVLLMGEDADKALDDSQRKTLRDAVDDVLPPTFGALRAEDGTATSGLCQAGMTFTVASAENLRDLRRTLQPVYDQLGTNDKTSAWLAAIEELKAAVAAGPDLATCSGTGSATGPQTVLDGTYQQKLVDGVVVAACTGTAPPRSPNDEATLELVLKNGVVTQYERRGGPGAPWEIGWAGTFRLFRDQIQLIQESTNGDRLTATWSFNGTRLTLTHLTGGRCGDNAVWTTHAWVRVTDR